LKKGLILWIGSGVWIISNKLLQTFDLADELKEFIDNLLGTEGDHAWSNEVDIVAHSMGGLVASTYLRKYPEHSRNHVHRRVTIATPYLGAPQVAAGHTRGYLFGLEENRVAIRPFKPDWGVILETFRNLPAAYTLLPSRAYFDTWEYLYYLENFEGDPLWNNTATICLSAEIIKSSGTDPQVTLVFPDVEGPNWEWHLSDIAEWIEPSALFPFKRKWTF
jgi:pimeloyl-ACP methyl ester carboxylesterase